MSSFGIKNHHGQLRRQKTCFEVGSTNSNKLRDSTTTTITTASTKRGFCLQRQLSVDATSVIVNPSKFASAYEKNNLISNNASDLSWKSGSNTSVNDRHGDHHSSPKSTAVPIIKKRTTQPTTTIINNKTTEQEPIDRHKKALKDRGNRLNLNIFLSHSTNSQDGDINGSDAESSNESMTIVNRENSNMTKSDIQSNCSKSSELISNNDSNISNDSDNSNNNQVPVKKVLDGVATSTKPVNSRRPPLVRAMSAPIRPKNEDTTSAPGGSDAATKAIQVKRKLKKKKIAGSRETRDDVLEERVDENDNELDDISNSSDSTSNILAPSISNIISNSICSNINNNNNNINNEIKKQIKSVKKPPLQRPRSAAVGNEVVTLVSLLSSGGSDSEKEDNHTVLPAGGVASATSATNKSDIIDFSTRHRAPMLRKSGKSVSFQERDLPPEIPSSTKDFSKYRRGSVAPIAARIRSNRPPTAPAGSIYLCDIDMNNDDFMKSIKTSSNSGICGSKYNYDLNADNANNNNRIENKKVAVESKQADEVEEIEINYPENVRTPKERECWRLYQKMLNRGVTVSYDTILRGMLTPTELRIIQKQNELKRNFDTDSSVCDGSENNSPTSSSENTARYGNANSSSNSNSSNLNELEND